ncbi:mevalonate kinase Ecym_6226 [Eremothecium cymbalariae DBVPG|uniref:Mevalonate kinase n=1 Tax=Eremothecium cymbalariae (strain CBS 270.75 / DBVPG 7215 / KCTC 17166 / NRRL Y-17582) TaxID=931890 RepID=G8JVC9_ERECY|nr:hypothetical protein Ecym_6226 [Eremothecium cymbalariae DBVPG\
MTIISPSVLLPLVTSAPGKVIIFGEHAAVYNRAAIAASVSSLRTYLFVSQCQDEETIGMEFPDIKFSCKWSHKELSSISKEVLSKCFHSKNLQSELTEFLEQPLSKLDDTLTRHAAFCFLYLYMCLCPDMKGIKFIMKSTLPIGAGLGSSASVAVCLSLAMAKLGGHIGHESNRLTAAEKAFINQWSLTGEKCIHGTPSGIDNAVATYGNAVLFQRQSDGSTRFEPMKDFPQIPMILTNTKIPKSTKVLVANVRKLVEKDPLITTPILDAMEQIAKKASKILPAVDTDTLLYAELLELVRINHGLLVSLGVSHPGLEAVKCLSDNMKVGATKLTGAGGGGCALTLLNKDIDYQEIDQFIDTLSQQYGYESFSTDLGGFGCCFLSRESMQSRLEEITRLFEEPSTEQQLTDMLLPGNSSLMWIHH